MGPSAGGAGGAACGGGHAGGCSGGAGRSGNALFGNLQVVAAKQLNLDPVLFAATNSSGASWAK